MWGLLGAPLKIVRMAGSLPVVRQIVKLHSKVPTPLSPFKTENPKTVVGVVRKALNPLNPENALGAALTGGPVISLIEEFGAGSTPQGDPNDPYSRWQYLGYKSRDDMKNRVETQLAKEQRYSIPAGPQMTAETYRRAREEKAQRTRTGLETSGPADPAFRTPGAPPAPSPSQAAAATALPSQGPAPAATAPDKMNELARLYAEQKQMGTELGAEEMVRRMKAASPSRYSVPEQDLVKWAASNPALAYREMVRREGLTG